MSQGNNKDFISKVVDDCLALIKRNTQTGDSGLRSELKTLLSAKLSQLDLVSRDDFEAQKKMLERTTAMVKELEETVSKIEQQQQQ